MEITNIELFLEYYSKIRQRTQRVMQCIPKEKIDWRPREYSFSFADIIRHIAAIERYMYAETVQGNVSSYPGHGKDLADGYEDILGFMDKMHRESVDIFKKLHQTRLREKCKTPAGTSITIWKWLRAMIEHEIHHRAFIYANLSLLDLDTPPLFDLSESEVRELSRAD